jgi:hypothetical protein
MANFKDIYLVIIFYLSHLVVMHKRDTRFQMVIQGF